MNRRLSRGELGFVIAVPLAWAVLLLFHPGGEGKEIYSDLNGDGTRMLVVHLGTMIFIPLLAAAIYLLLQGIESTAAQVSRLALVFFVVFYGAWEILQGVANGILVDEVSALPEGDHALGADVIQGFAESPLVSDFGVLSTIGSLALIVAMIAAGIALRNAGAPGWSPAVFGFAGLLITAHPPPFGPTGLAIFAVAVVLLTRSRTQEGAAAPQSVPPGPMQRRAFSRGELAFLIGVPVAWALLLLLHPVGDDFYSAVRDEVTRWEIVHLSTMIFIPLMAAVVYLLLRGVEGRAALVARFALPFFVVFYGAFEILIGVGMGALVNEVNALSAAEVPVGKDLVDGYGDSRVIEVIELVGSVSWLVAVLATGLALFRNAGASVWVPILMALSAVPIAFHVPPFGQVGLGLFVAAMLIYLKTQSPRKAPAPMAQPGTA